MEFYDFLTGYDCAHRQGLSLPLDQFFQKVERQGALQTGNSQQRAVELNRFRAEKGWLQLGRPYFKIWPGVIPLLANVGLDVPPTYLRLPFAAFVLRLPQTENPLMVNDQYQVRSIMVVDGEVSDGTRIVTLWTDIGERQQQNWPMLHWSHLTCRSDQTIEEAFGGNRMPDLPGIRLSEDLNKLCLRLAVSIGFLSTGMDRLVEPDILGKDFAAYAEAQRNGDEHRVRSIENRALRRGKKGWNVGKHERLRSLKSRSSSNTEGSTERGSLTHQHQRRAHFRLLPSGKVVFVRQATVRPDLPPPVFGPGYAVK